MRQLLTTRQFELDFQKIPTDIKLKTGIALSVLKQNPFSQTLKIKKLKGLGKSFWRLKIDRNYRLIYSLGENSIVLHRIRHRKDIYRNF